MSSLVGPRITKMSTVRISLELRTRTSILVEKVLNNTEQPLKDVRAEIKELLARPHIALTSSFQHSSLRLLPALSAANSSQCQCCPSAPSTPRRPTAGSPPPRKCRTVSPPRCHTHNTSSADRSVQSSECPAAPQSSQPCSDRRRTPPH